MVGSTVSVLGHGQLYEFRHHLVVEQSFSAFSGGWIHSLSPHSPVGESTVFLRILWWVNPQSFSAFSGGWIHSLSPHSLVGESTVFLRILWRVNPQSSHSLAGESSNCLSFSSSFVVFFVSLSFFLQQKKKSVEKFMAAVCITPKPLLFMQTVCLIYACVQVSDKAMAADQPTATTACPGKPDSDEAVQDQSEKTEGGEAEETVSEDMDFAGDEEEEEDDGDGEWITPDNLHRVKEAMGGGHTVEITDKIPVACMTTDFAMQVSRSSEYHPIPHPHLLPVYFCHFFVRFPQLNRGNLISVYSALDRTFFFKWVCRSFPLMACWSERSELTSSAALRATSTSHLSFSWITTNIYVCSCMYYPGQKKRTIIEIRGEKNAVPRVISCSIRCDQRRASPIRDCPRLLPWLIAPDRAWYHTWNSVLLAANLDDGSFFCPG